MAIGIFPIATAIVMNRSFFCFILSFIAMQTKKLNWLLTDATVPNCPSYRKQPTHTDNHNGHRQTHKP